jgi:hypothetical protein
VGFLENDGMGDHIRWRSGSTTLTILLHMAINLLATLQTAVKVHGWA